MLFNVELSTRRLPRITKCASLPKDQKRTSKFYVIRVSICVYVVYIICQPETVLGLCAMACAWTMNSFAMVSFIAKTSPTRIRICVGIAPSRVNIFSAHLQYPRSSSPNAKFKILNFGNWTTKFIIGHKIIGNSIFNAITFLSIYIIL